MQQSEKSFTSTHLTYLPRSSTKAQDIWEKKYWMGKLSLLLLWLRAPRGEMFAVIWHLCIHSYSCSPLNYMFIKHCLGGVLFQGWEEDDGPCESDSGASWRVAFPALGGELPPSRSFAPFRSETPSTWSLKAEKPCPGLLCIVLRHI